MLTGQPKCTWHFVEQLANTHTQGSSRGWVGADFAGQIEGTHWMGVFEGSNSSQILHTHVLDICWTCLKVCMGTDMHMDIFSSCVKTRLRTHKSSLKRQSWAWEKAWALPNA